MLQVLIIVAFISRSNHFVYIELNSQNHHELGNSCNSMVYFEISYSINIKNRTNVQFVKFKYLLPKESHRKLQN